MKVIEGDLLDRGLGFEAIGHGVNCKGLMGAGIAKQIADTYPKILPAYRAALFEDPSSQRLKLGGVHAFHTGDNLTIYNLATQYLPGPHANLAAIWSSVSRAMLDCAKWDIKELALPMIGAGLGGLPWPDVHHVLSRLSSASPTVKLVVVRYVPKEG